VTPARSLQLCARLAWAGIALGVVVGIAGVLHTSAVISVALSQGKPYDFRLVALLATGGGLIYLSVINIGISRWIRLGHPWALMMSAVVVFPLMVYEALLFPAHHSNHVFGVILTALYLSFLIRVAVSKRAPIVLKVRSKPLSEN
jgi:galactitol-specific phosphotransferase system IIC component